MTGIRRAFVLASLGRYLTMVINLAVTLILARLLAPADYGVAVLGNSVLAVAEAVRALGGGAYLVQQKELTPAQIHTNFTISLIATLVLLAALLVFLPPLTGFFGQTELESFLRVSVWGFVAGPINYQILALMGRHLAFGRIAFITSFAAAINGGVSISLALLGWGFMSLAWASAISALSAMGLYLFLWRDRSIFRFAIREWRSVFGFGLHDSAVGIMSQIGEAVPYLIIGRFLDPTSVGLCQRALLLAFFPERVILAGVGAVALPAFAQQVREGGTLKVNYVRALGLITAVQWPALVTLILLADPIVRILLGNQWLSVVPLLQILASALIFSFPIALHYPTLVALGAIRIVPRTILPQLVVTIGVLAFAAPFGINAVAWSAFLSVPFCALVSLLVIRHFLNFTWLELAGAIGRSAVAAISCAVVLVVVLAATENWRGIVSVPIAIVAGLLGGAGWIAGLRLTRHPLLQEMTLFGAKAKSRIWPNLEQGGNVF
jgi:O-antigen/teichoic acid export membrane protein